MSAHIPAHFAQYSQTLNRNRREEEKKDKDDQENLFNGSFEDIRQILQDGWTVAVVKTESIFRREKESRGRFGDYSLLLRRIVDIKTNAKPKVQLEIQSDRLRSAFARIAANMTTLRLNHDPIVIPEPYVAIYHRGQAIQDAMDAAAAKKDELLRAELQLLVDFRRDYMTDTINTIDKFLASGSIEFGWLWAIFPPGERVVIENRSASASASPIQWCVVVKAFEIQQLDSGAMVWCLSVTHTGFNGLRFGTVETSFTFPHFSDNVPITRLPAYPLRFCKDQDRLVRHAIQRGKAYEAYSLASSKVRDKPIGTAVHHDGPIWTERDPGQTDRRGCRIVDSPSNSVRGRSIVDLEGFFADSPNFRESLAPDNVELPDEDSDDDSALGRIIRRHREQGLRRTLTGGSLSGLGSPQTVASLSDDELLTCPPLIPIFSFAVRRWCLAFIDDLSDIDWNPDTFDHLQVDGELKGAIQGLVQGYSTHGADFDDFVEGKGKGLVFLLHGPPGCGKTMTAESISESLKKPLYHVSGGELGSSVDSIQYALERAFELAARWDCILLLDEADAFLSKRDGADIERNSLIAVFLRLLEYQSGIIFLTTNRLGDFDPAFESRIHLLIPFAALDAPKRGLIWDRLAQKNGNCALTTDQVMALGRLPLDGRRIKNILRLASLFAANRYRGKDAEAESLAMTFGDIKKVLPLAVARVTDVSDCGNGGNSLGGEELSGALAALMNGTALGE